MPRGKKKAPTKEIKNVTPDPVKEIIEEAKDKYFCGHQNMHYVEGVLKCTLGKGHKGDHSAILNSQWSFWSDAAGTPVRKHA